MTSTPKELLELRQLYYFFVVAEELNLHRAAARLFMSQPPLSRNIKALETRLGIILFERHTRGLSLTKEGKEALRIIRPLLVQHDATLASLNNLVKTHKKQIIIGFTTGFEQGLFSPLESALHKYFAGAIKMVRMSSQKLIREVKNKKVDIAFVALPIETKGVLSVPLGYAEAHIAALPASWTLAKQEQVTFATLAYKPVFWFKREANPALFDLARSMFVQGKFNPVFITEPAEHDVLLARIAAEEGAAILPASFAVVQRKGVVFKPFPLHQQLSIQLGIVANSAYEETLRTLLPLVQTTPPCSAPII